MHYEIDSSAGENAENGAPGWRFAVAAGILGWVLDAFGFFVVVFLITELMGKFHVSKGAIVLTMSLTLMMRPLGALLFGALADRYGRRRPLMVCVLYLSAVSMLSGLAPTYWIFLTTQMLYGLGMGGYWGIGASYAMESAPVKARGFLSGMMQGGYPFGYLMASIAIQTVAPAFGWSAMFFAGFPLALLIVVFTLYAPESAAWQINKTTSVKKIFNTLFAHKAIFGYLLLLMIAMNSLSHGTQDLYPDFLKTLPWLRGARILGMKANLGIPVLYNIGAVAGALGVGALSQRVGRRFAMMLALGLSLLAMPLWAFGGSVLAIVLGAYLMQTGVQGAFGVVPAHLNELAPPAIRGLFPGFVYQLGVLFAALVLPLENTLRIHFGYPWALCSFETVNIVALLLLFGFGPEKLGRSFIQSEEEQVVALPAAVEG